MDKPKIKHVTFCRNEGKFNWLNPKEINAQYVFNFPHLTIEQIAEMDLKTSFLVDIEKDYGFSPESLKKFMTVIGFIQDKKIFKNLSSI